jgi:phosphopantothenate synthetase
VTPYIAKVLTKRELKQKQDRVLTAGNMFQSAYKRKRVPLAFVMTGTDLFAVGIDLEDLVESVRRYTNTKVFPVDMNPVSNTHQSSSSVALDAIRWMIEHYGVQHSELENSSRLSDIVSNSRRDVTSLGSAIPRDMLP